MSGRKSDVKERACSNGSLESLVHLQNASFNKSACSICWDFSGSTFEELYDVI